MIYLSHPFVSENSDQADMPLSADDDAPGGDQVTCTWCQKRAAKSFKSIDGGTETRAFCSEVCFTHWRRAFFKRNKVCNWCRHVRHTLSYVDFQDGDQQLQFCSNKCLNQYKMNIFCRETQEHLAQMDTGVIATAPSNKQILITPELWSDTDTKSSPSTRNSPPTDNAPVDLGVNSAVTVKVEPDVGENLTVERKTQEPSGGKSSTRAQSFGSSCDTLHSPLTSPSPSHCLSPPSSCNSCSDGSVFNTSHHPHDNVERIHVSAPSHYQVGPARSPQLHSRVMVSPRTKYGDGHMSRSSKHAQLSPSSGVAGARRNSPFGQSAGQRQSLPPPVQPVPMPHPIPPMPLLASHLLGSLGHHAAAGMFPMPGPFPPANGMPMPPFPNPLMPPNTLMVPYPIPIPFPVPIPIPIPIPIREDWKKFMTEQEGKKVKDEHRSDLLPDSCQSSTSSTSHDHSPSAAHSEPPRENISPKSGKSPSGKPVNRITCACCQSQTFNSDANASMQESDATCLKLRRGHRSPCLAPERPILCSLANNNEVIDLSKEKTVAARPDSTEPSSLAKKHKMEQSLKIPVPSPGDLAGSIPTKTLILGQPNANTTPYSARRSRILDAPRVPKETSPSLIRSSYAGLASATSSSRDALYGKRRCIRPHIKSKWL